MDYKFESLKEGNLLLVKTQGKHMVSANTTFIEDMYKAYIEFDCNKILIDYRRTEVSIDIVTALGRPAVYDAMAGIRRPEKVALVFEETKPSYQHFEEVCQNRGWNLIVCDNYDFAIDWIKAV